MLEMLDGEANVHTAGIFSTIHTYRLRLSKVAESVSLEVGCRMCLHFERVFEGRVHCETAMVLK